MVEIRKNPIIKKLLSLNLPSEDFAIFGSGPLFAHGLTELKGDIDIVARGEAWKKAKTLAEVKDASYGEAKTVELFDGDIEIFNGWSPGDWSVNKLIDNADTIDGLRFVKLKTVLKWKNMINREKDKKHNKLIKNHLKKKN